VNVLNDICSHIIKKISGIARQIRFGLFPWKLFIQILNPKKKKKREGQLRHNYKVNKLAELYVGCLLLKSAKNISRHTKKGVGGYNLF
jgi:hypothetical protein